MRGARLIAGAHAGYLAGTGIWAVVHRRSFEAVTGPKHDYWLVRIVGALAAVLGATLALAVARNRRTPEAVAAATGSVVVFSAASAWAGKNRSRIYFGDLLVQPLALAGWLRSWGGG
jgi:hypothetical protein